MKLIVGSKKVKRYRMDTWHYRLTRYAFGRQADRICRVCLHWSLLVPAAAIVGSLRFTGTLMYWVGLRLISILGFYPWIAFVWLIGYKPRYWGWLHNSVWIERQGLCFQNFEVDRHYPKKGKGLYWHQRKFHRWPALYIVPMVGAAVLAVNHFGTRATGVSGLTSLAWYWLAAVAYFSLIALIGFIQGYRRTLLPYLKRFYFAICPEIEWIDPAENAEMQEAA